MGVSTDAILCYGFNITEEEPPWMEDEEGDIDSWWQKANGHYVEYGDDRVKNMEIYRASEQWLIDNPMPEIVWHCSYDYPMFIAAVKGSGSTARRGSVEEIKELPSFEPEKVGWIKEWLDTYEIEHEGPGWYLVSMWG